MIKTIPPTQLHGSIRAKASKSCAHRLLICAALGENEVTIRCEGMNRDIEATIACLNAMGADISTQGSVIRVRPIGNRPAGECTLPCGESGSTLRFLLPVVGALGLCGVFHMEGRLGERPLAPLDAELTRHGMVLSKEGSVLRCSGQLQPGDYILPGNVSSQYISGLLMALPLLGRESRLEITGAIESAAYIALTENALAQSAVPLQKDGAVYTIRPSRFALPPETTVEGDWSNAAFWLCAGALLDEGLTVTGLDLSSAQGDREVLSVLRRFGALVEAGEDSIFVRRGELRGISFSAAAIPDLVPVLSVVACAAKGESRITDASRLRIKESDRLAAVHDLLSRLGAEVEELADGLVIHGGKPLTGGSVSAWGDHRIAMSAAVAALLCQEDVYIDGAQNVSKSYPDFWCDYDTLST